MILSFLGCAVAVLAAQQPSSTSTASSVDGAHFLTSIRSYAESHGSGPVLADDNLDVQTRVTSIDNSHMAYKLVMSAREANRSKFEYAESRFDFDWKNAYAIQVDPSNKLGWRVTLFMVKPIKCWALMTPRLSSMTTTMVLNERALPFAHANVSDIDECYFWFSTPEESNAFRNLLVGAVRRLTGADLLRVDGNVIREADYGLPDDNLATWQKHQKDAVLDGVIPYEPKSSATGSDGAEVLAVGPASSFTAGEFITGIKLPDGHSFTRVRNWSDLRAFLSKTKSSKVVVQTSVNTEATNPGRLVDLTYTVKGAS